LDRVRALLDRLLEAGYLRTTGLDYPVLQLTPQGLLVMKGENPVLLAAGAGTDEAAARDTGSRSLKRTKRARGAPAAASATASAAAGDPRLLESLRDFRKDEAKRRGVPAYVVFHDATLVELSSLRPRSMNELGGISGLGPKKIELYGEKLLSLLKTP
jgi:ATP-dependent DNA helicase RecQ